MSDNSHVNIRCSDCNNVNCLVIKEMLQDDLPHLIRVEKIISQKTSDD